MAEDTTDKSIVLWYPYSSVHDVPDIRELTSLCLFHDQVVLGRLAHPIEESKLCKRYVERLATFVPYSSAYWQSRVDFNEKLKILEKETIVQIITSDDYRSLSGKTAVPFPNIKRFWDPLEYGEEAALKTFELVEEMVTYHVMKYYNYPFVSDEATLRAFGYEIKLNGTLSSVLTQSVISQLSLPDVKAVHVEDLLEARTELKDELIEFRAGILKLTWLLHQQVQNKNDLRQIRQEADVLVNTVIKGSLLSLENRMRQHKKKTIRRMLFGTGRVLVEATKLFLPSGAAEKMISGGKGLLQLATELDSEKPPEDQVATYLYKLRNKLNTEV